MKSLFFSIVAVFAALPATSPAQQVAGSPTPPAPPPPPAIQTAPPEAGPVRSLISWTAGSAMCDGVAVPMLRAVPVESDFSWISSGSELLKSGTFTFRIDATGRPLSITRPEKQYLPYGDTVEPALAASAFAPGHPRAHCTISYMPHNVPMMEAPIDQLITYSIFPRGQQLPREAFDRIAPADTDCAMPPAVLVRAYPDFKTIAQQPATRSWSMVSFDIDRGGRPINLRTNATSGNTALDRASLDAVRRSRFEAGDPRHGCLYPYWRRGEAMAAPPIPDNAPKNDPAKCPVEGNWASALARNFPDAYRRRGVEGWAIISYDVAPWGATGNAKVLASEPSDAFGTMALQLIQAGRKAPSDRGYAGCISRVRYVLPKPGAKPVKPEPDETSAGPPPVF